MENVRSYNNNEEFDLLELIRKIRSFTLSYRMYLIIFPLIGSFAGIAYHFSSKPKYSSVMMLQTKILSKVEQIEIIKSWNELITDGSEKVLAQKLNLNNQAISKLRKITGEELEISLSLAQNDQNTFLVNVTVNDSSILNPLQNGIVYALQNGDYIKARTEIARSNYLHLINSTNLEILKLDSVRNRIVKDLEGVSEEKSSFMIDISGINEEIIHLNEKLLDYKECLKFVDPIQVLKGFDEYRRSEKRLEIPIICGLFIGLIVGLAASFYLYICKRLRK